MFQVAYIFPGQGAQYVGMGKDLYENSPQVKEVFQRARKILGFDIARLCFEGPKPQLERTINSQPAILTVSVALLSALKGLALDLKPKAVAGLSVGEYSALVAAGCIGLEDALRLIRKRAEFMEEASRRNPGKMAAIIGLAKVELERLCREVGCEVANFNCPGQIVISGSLDAMDRAIDMAKSRGARYVVELDVSGPFHSSLMASVKERLSEELNGIELSDSRVPIVANFTGRYENLKDEIKENLINQVNHGVMWEDSIRLMAGDGITDFLEIGPGKVLKGLLHRIDPDLRVHNIEDTQSLFDFLRNYGGTSHVIEG